MQNFTTSTFSSWVQKLSTKTLKLGSKIEQQSPKIDLKTCLETCCFLTSVFNDCWLHFAFQVEIPESDRKVILAKLAPRGAQERSKSAQERFSGRCWRFQARFWSPKAHNETPRSARRIMERTRNATPPDTWILALGGFPRQTHP